MLISQKKQDAIYNALTVGMALEDAYIYAGLTAAEIEAVTTDIDYQAQLRQVLKDFEFGLLSDLREVQKRQIAVGRETAITWALEHMFPRYSGKPQNETGEVHLHFENKDPALEDTVEIFKPTVKGDK